MENILCLINYNKSINVTAFREQYNFSLIKDGILLISEYEAMLVKMKTTQKNGQVNWFAMCII